LRRIRHEDTADAIQEASIERSLGVAARHPAFGVIQAVTYRDDNEDQVNGEYDIDDIIDGFEDLSLGSSTETNQASPSEQFAQSTYNPFSLSNPTLTNSSLTNPSYFGNQSLGFSQPTQSPTFGSQSSPFGNYNNYGHTFGQQSTFGQSSIFSPSLGYGPTSSFDNQPIFGQSSFPNSQLNASFANPQPMEEDRKVGQLQAKTPVVQRGIKTRSGGSRATGPGSTSYVGMSTGSGGGHPPVPKAAWQTQTTANGTTYKFYNDGNGVLEFTGHHVGLPPTAGPALPVHHSVNIEDTAKPGRMKYNGRSLVNSRYQHFLVANLDYEGIKNGKTKPINGGNSPPGYTWHHHEKKGEMELIDREVHGLFGHHGGYSIWGSK
jgi:hypothetical protein